MKEDDIRKRSIFNEYLKLVQKDVENIFYDKSKFFYVPCPACGNESFVDEFTKWGFNYVTCTVCKTLYVNPRPSLDSLLYFYTKSESAFFWANEFFKPVEENRRKQIFKPRVNFVTESFPELSNGVIGDIGAGLGLFLQELKECWPLARLVAIEPSEEEYNICRAKGLEIIPCALEEVRGWEEKFDILTSFELIEHLYDLNTFLKKAWTLLKPGGYLYITTLNGQGFDIQVLWDHSKCFSPPNHLNFLNPSSIKRLFENNGFIIQNIDTPGVLDWDIVEGMIKNENIRLERFWHLLADKSDQSTKQELQRCLTKFNLSSHMRVLARK